MVSGGCRGVRRGRQVIKGLQRLELRKGGVGRREIPEDGVQGIHGDDGGSLEICCVPVTRFQQILVYPRVNTIRRLRGLGVEFHLGVVGQGGRGGVGGRRKGGEGRVVECWRGGRGVRGRAWLIKRGV